MNIPSYILIKSWYYYLHIEGGTGSLNGLGGQYSYYLYYCSPGLTRGEEAADYWCNVHSIVCGVGATIEDAYADYLKKSK